MSTGIGHSHPLYIQTVYDQVQKIGFYSNSVINRLREQLAERLGRISGYDDYSLLRTILTRRSSCGLRSSEPV